MKLSKRFKRKLKEKFIAILAMIAIAIFAITSYKTIIMTESSGLLRESNNSSAIETQYVVKTVYNFDYTGTEKTLTVPAGRYKLETWGASGSDAVGYNQSSGSHAGLGGYSTGIINFSSETTLYINVGGSSHYGWVTGGYNGGGESYGGPGGGATHIATRSGLLQNLENYVSNILIVSGGGGGADDPGGTPGGHNDGTGGSGGGAYSGPARISGAWQYGTVADQTSGYAFGLGERHIVMMLVELEEAFMEDLQLIITMVEQEGDLAT